MSEFQAARDALARSIRRVFPSAKRVPGWPGIEAWGAPRPQGALVDAAARTFDPARIVIGIADRRTGPVVYLLDPGDFFALETHRALLEGAGLKLGRSCIMHTRKGPLPTDALETLFRRVKARDAAAKAPARGRPEKGAAPASVDAYLAALPPPQRAALERLRRLVRAAAPRATEKMTYGMPTWVHEGNLAHMAAFKEHCSFFPGRAGVALRFADELEGYATTKASIHFAPDKPLPAALVKRIVKMRVAENEARAAERKEGKARKAGIKRSGTKGARRSGTRATRSP